MRGGRRRIREMRVKEGKVVGSSGKRKETMDQGRMMERMKR